MYGGRLHGDAKRRKICETLEAMDFRSVGNFSDAWDWLDVNLEWINSSLLHGKLKLDKEKETYFYSREDEYDNESPEYPNILDLTHDEWISASKRLISLFEDHAALFGQLACLKVNWELGVFMDNDVKYLKDYLKAYSISIQDPTLYQPFRSSRDIGPTINNVFNLCYFLGSFSTGIGLSQNVTEDFLLPNLLFMKLMQQAGFFKEDSLQRYIRVTGTGTMKVHQLGM